MASRIARALRLEGPQCKTEVANGFRSQELKAVRQDMGREMSESSTLGIHEGHQIGRSGWGYSTRSCSRQG